MKHKIGKFATWLIVASLSLALAAAIIATFGTLPTKILNMSPVASKLKPVEAISAESNIRGSILQAIGGILLLAGALTAWNQMIINRRQQVISFQSALTDTFSKAVEQLSNVNSTAVRLGGIYSLDRIAQQERSEGSRVCEILTEFIRESCEQNQYPEFNRDVKAALFVITRRDWPEGINFSGITLKGVHLAQARLVRARLEKIDLSEADLSKAILSNADLSGADLRRARLKGTDLSSAKLDRARLSGATMDDQTRWPKGFNPFDHGVLVEN
ncbi:pentapeptide repeat-containing protein [Streptosporangium sp. V21-05]|uniref:pentapeptide repeat-containing protein n=1 Tax=Streptosporangium sp. V21-05 TaxID=3446115 RepID=UPI003F53800F